MKKSDRKPVPAPSDIDIKETESLRPATGLLKEIDATFVRAPRSFLGQRLWEFTEGERTLYRLILREGDSNEFLGMLLVTLLRDLQREYDKQVGLNRGRDMALELATADFLAASSEPNRYRAKVIGEMRTLTPSQIHQAAEMGAEILADATDTEMMPAEEGPAAGN